MLFVGPVSNALAVNNPAALSVTMLAVLAVLWTPTFRGLLQGLHRFASFGWLLILEGVVRLGIFILLVNRSKADRQEGCGPFLPANTSPSPSPFG